MQSHEMLTDFDNAYSKRMVFMYYREIKKNEYKKIGKQELCFFSSGLHFIISRKVPTSNK